MVQRTKEQKAIVEQIMQVAEGLGDTFAPFCEVVVHDLLDPKHAILALHNNLSGREIGQPATELGLARIANPDYPQIVANYANTFADGRPVKSTSVGLKDSTGKYIAALCLNIDLTLFRGLQGTLDRFVKLDSDPETKETLDPQGADAIRHHIDQFAARAATTPRALRVSDRRALLKELKASGVIEIRRGMEIVARHLGVSRATVYSDAK
jgi:predicted transcriptional regulator YheO